jgi:hypothetical protein
MREIQKDTNWVFELEDDGTVLHSFPHQKQAEESSATELVGYNFFEDATGFDNISDFERHFKTFVRSRKAVETFTLRCSQGSEAVNAKVIMTRAYQTTSYCLPTGVVMLEIRGN